MTNAKRLHTKKEKKPDWATEELYQQMVNHWNNQRFIEKSAKCSASRRSEAQPGDGPHRHLSGSKSYVKRKIDFVSNLIVFYIFI